MGRPIRRLRGAAALVVVLSMSGCGNGPSPEGPVANFSAYDGDGMNGVVLPKPYAVPDVTLTDTEGDPYNLTEDTTKPLTLVFFGYTRCPDICQVVMADIASALTRLDGADRASVGMLFITSDPARDDAATLRGYLDRFDPSFEGLTGDLGHIVTVGNALGVPIEHGSRLPSGGYEVAHGTQIVGVEDDGHAPIVWTQGTSAAQLAEDFTTLLNANGLSTGTTTGSGPTTGSEQ